MASLKIFRNESPNNTGDRQTRSIWRFFVKKTHGVVIVSRLDASANGSSSTASQNAHVSSTESSSTPSSNMNYDSFDGIAERGIRRKFLQYFSTPLFSLRSYYEPSSRDRTSRTADIENELQIIRPTSSSGSQYPSLPPTSLTDSPRLSLPSSTLSDSRHSDPSASLFASQQPSLPHLSSASQCPSLPHTSASQNSSTSSKCPSLPHSSSASQCPSLPHTSASQNSSTSSKCPSLSHSSSVSQYPSLPHPSSASQNSSTSSKCPSLPHSQHLSTGSKCPNVPPGDQYNSSLRSSDYPSLPKVPQSSKKHVPPLSKKEKKKLFKHILPSISRPQPSQPSDTIGVGILRISAEEMAEATDNWNESKALGKGGFGKVYKGTFKNTDLAFKRIERQLVEEPSLSELECMNRYRHDNILSLYGYGFDNDTLCLICQVMPNGSLFDQLQHEEKSKALVSSVRICKVATGAAKGLQYLHLIEPPLVHGDIKSANILLDEHFEPKICDFGFAREGRETQLSRICGTEPYLDKEFRKKGKLSDKVDIYAFGVVLAELATGLTPLVNINGKRQFLRDYIHSYTGNMMDLLDNNAGPKSELYLELVELAKACTKENSLERPDMVTVYNELKVLKEKITDLRAKYAGDHQWNAETGQFSNLEDHILTKGDVENYRQGVGPQTYQIFVLYVDADKSCADDIRDKMELERGLDFCDAYRDIIEERQCDEYTMMRLISERCKKLLVILSQEFSKSTLHTSLLKQAQSSAFAKKLITVIPCISNWDNLRLEYRAYYSLDYVHRKHTKQFWETVYKSCTEEMKPIERDMQGFPDLDELGAFTGSLKDIEPTLSSFARRWKKISFFPKFSRSKRRVVPQGG